MFYSESMGLWVERVKAKDGKVKSISAKTQKALKEKIKAFSAKENAGRTFGECADAWFEIHEKKIEPTTAAAYSSHVTRAKEYFEGRHIKDITPDEVQGYVDSLIEHDFAKDTVRRGLVVINKIFKWAITQPGSEIRFNPCAAVEIPRGLKQEIRQPPTPEQVAKVSLDPKTEIGLFALFLLCTGLRPGELLALQWKDIDRENKIITVHGTAQYAQNTARIKPTTKTAAGMRTVPLLDVLDRALPANKSGFVFGGEEPWTKTMVFKRWLAWCKEVDLAEPTETEFTGRNGHRYKKTTWKAKVTPYQFRHEYASMLEDEGVSEFDAQHVMGHASIVTTKDKYTQFRNTKKLKESSVADKLNARFNE